MKPAKTPNLSESAKNVFAEKNVDAISEISGYQFHPVRRVSDNCPISRMPFSSEYPPTSPKIHEIREREAAQAAADARTKSFISK